MNDLLEAVGEDPDLLPVEKETTIRLPKDRDTIRVFTAEAGLMRRLLAHPHADVQTLNTLEDGTRQTASIDEYAAGTIVGVVVDLPVGALQIKSSPRQTDQHAAIVSDRVFEGGDA